jgi:protein-S-isoprenylcysteine O-methyltransferase Ste14
MDGFVRVHEPGIWAWLLSGDAARGDGDREFHGVIAEARLSRLTKKALRGLLRFLFFMALLLFVPAWSLDFWQAWLFLGLFGASCLWITFYFLRHDPALVERRMEVGPRAEQEPSQRRIQAIASLFTCGLLIVPALDHRLRWSMVPLWSVLVAEGVIAVGFVLTVFVFRENSHTAGTVKVEADQKVVCTGPYRVIRHPFYAAATLLFLATPIALGSWWGLAVAIPLLGVIVVRLLHEEQFLTVNLPGYSDYCGAVRYRLIPLVW